METGLKALIVIIIAVMVFVIFGSYYLVYVNTGQLLNSNPATANNQNLQNSADNSAASTTIATGEVTLSGSHVTDTFNITEQDFSYIPSVIEVGAGDTVIMHVKNIAKDDIHDLYIQALNISTPILSPGQNATLVFTAPSTPGNYSFYCTVAMHADMGMDGTMIVEELPSQQAGAIQNTTSIYNNSNYMIQVNNTSNMTNAS
jgi:plastocyanin